MGGAAAQLVGWTTGGRFAGRSGSVESGFDAWLRGYRSVLPLPADDEAEIPTFVLLRRLQLVSWVGSHRFADSALELGADFTQGACELAERYDGACSPQRDSRRSGRGGLRPTD
jgi:Ser/Thr protein kinase RdoA (MazF antagonist)